MLEFSVGELLHVSGVYETAAWGKEDQPNFLNAALSFKTDMPPLLLFNHLQETEFELGALKKVIWGPREIDIDLIFFDQQIIQTKKLKVPHPRAHLRNFVLAPLCDIIPNYRHPQLKRTIEELYLSSKDTLEVSLTDQHL